MLVRVAVICNRIGQVQRLSYLRDIQMKIETGTGYRLGQRQELAEGRAIDRGPFISVRSNWARFRYDQDGKQWQRLHNGYEY